LRRSRSSRAWIVEASERLTMFVTSLIVCGSGTGSSETRAPSCAIMSAARRTAASISASMPWKK